MNLKQLLDELKRRNVYKVAVAYLLTCWLILQVASVLFPVFEVSNGVLRALTVVLIVGFPVIILLAWIYEITPEGLKPTDSVESSSETTKSAGKILNRIIIGVLLVAVAVLIIDRSRIVLQNDGLNADLSSARISKQDREKRITVLSFVNQTNNPEMSAYGNMLSDWITRGLMETQDANVVNSANLMHLFGDSQSGAAFNEEFVEKSGIDLLLQGRYYQAEDQMIVVADITDIMSGEIVRTFQSEGPRESSMDLLDGLTEKIMSYWAVRDHVQFSQDPPKYEAYEEYLDGLALYTINAVEANVHMENAFRIDNTFYPPLFRSMALNYNLGQFENAYEIRDFLMNKKSRFTDFESLDFESIVAIHEHEFLESAKLTFQKYEIDPSDIRANFSAAAMYNSANYPKKVLESLAAYDVRLSGEHEGVIGWRITLQAFANYRLRNYNAVHQLVQENSFSRMPHALADFHMLALIRMDSIQLIPYFYQKYSGEGVYGFTGMKVTDDQLLVNICSELLVTGKLDILADYAQKLRDWVSENEVVEFSHDLTDIWNNVPFRQEESQGYAHFFLRDFEKAIQAWSKESIPISNWPDKIERASRIGHCFAMLGDSVNANLYLEEIASVELDHPELASQKSYYIARVLSSLGQHNEAIKELENSVRNGLSYFRIFSFERDPFLVPLFEYPGFQELVSPIVD